MKDEPSKPETTSGQDTETPANPGGAPTLTQIAARRFSRRTLFSAVAAGAGVAAMAWWWRGLEADGSLGFAEVTHDIGPDHAVAPGYQARVLIRWGDPVLAAAPPFAAGIVDAAAQRLQFGFNNDFTAYFPLPRRSDSSDHGLLCVNHEYTDRDLMWPAAVTRQPPTREEVRAQMAAHGASVIEIRRRESGWSVVADSVYRRRITALDTLIHISGPAAGHPRLRTGADPGGRTVVGMINNCAGGVTPWGTVLTCEENFHYYFGGDPAKTPQVARFARYGIRGRPFFAWHRHEPRFHVEVEPNEANRFGWVVEYDPYNPDLPPVKRTALGRCKHEGAGTVVSANGRLVVYSGDDEAFEYLYKFVSDRPVDPENRMANWGLLDSGVLYVARFNEDGWLDWLPLVYGQGGLDGANGFADQADVLIDARRAADFVGATPLDRPEDVEVNPKTGRTYVILTHNGQRAPGQTDAANPRAPNPFGHILELIPPGDGPVRDHAARRCRWEIFLLGGDPRNPEHGARYHPGVSEHGWLAAPDNCAFDPAGRLWIATDQGSAQARRGVADGIYACETVGPGRALTRLFYKVPVGAECAGPSFTPDGRTLFLSVQHPGEGSTFEAPTTRWPDFAAGIPPRPAVVAITKSDGGEIGG